MVERVAAAPDRPQARRAARPLGGRLRAAGRPAGSTRWTDAFLADGPVRGEVWYARPDGSSAYLVSDLVLVRDATGTGRYGLITVHDDTVTRAVEDLLRATNAELDSIVANAPARHLRHRPRRLVQLWNPQAELMFGWPLDEVLGRPGPVRVQRSLVDRRPSRRPTGRSRSGTSRWRTARAGPSTSGCGPRSARTVRRTGRRALRVHRHLRADGDPGRAGRERAPLPRLVQNISDTVSIVDAEGRILFTSGQTQPVLGHEVSYWNDRSIFDVCHPDDVDRCERSSRTSRSTPGQQNTGERGLGTPRATPGTSSRSRR